MRELVSNNISYSLLSSFVDNGPEALVKRIENSNTGITFGKQFDDLISLSKDEFNEKYLIIQNNITGDLFTLAKAIVDIPNIDINKIILDESIETINKLAINLNLFKAVKKDETRIKKFNNKEFYDFVRLLYDNSNKEFINPTEYSKLLECKQSLFTNNSTGSYFNCNKDCEEYYQVEYHFKYKDRNIKVIFDKIIIDNVNKTIQPLDIKTGANKAEEFNSSFFKFKYYIQGGLYTKAIHEMVKDGVIPNYQVKPFKYIYLPTYDFMNPKTFILTDKWYNAAWEGFTTRSGYYYKGINELIDEINWHIENQVFNVSKVFNQNNEIDIDDSYINLE